LWGDTSLAEGDYAGAAAKLEQAAKLLEQAAGPRKVAGVLTSLGRVYRTHGYPARAKALADTREALRAIEQLRERLVPNDFMKRGFADQYPRLYASAIELLHQSGRAAEALETAEQARARAFLDLLAAREEADTETPALALRGAGEAGTVNAVQSGPWAVSLTSGIKAQIENSPGSPVLVRLLMPGHKRPSKGRKIKVCPPILLA
jgi:tetratricopeptide (TPR) repeat protein